jgi:hypothetical protein
MPQCLIDHRGWGILRLLLCTAAFALRFSRLAMASDVTAPIEQLDAALLVRTSGADGLLARLKQKTTELSGGSVR